MFFDEQTSLTLFSPNCSSHQFLVNFLFENILQKFMIQLERCRTAIFLALVISTKYQYLLHQMQNTYYLKISFSKYYTLQ